MNQPIVDRFRGNAVSLYLRKEIRTVTLITHNIKAVLFDFGGVLSEEGFREGLMAIGRAARFSPEAFFETAAAAVYDSGYVLGKADESAYWAMVRERTGIKGSDKEFRREILERFQLATLDVGNCPRA